MNASCRLADVEVDVEPWPACYRRGRVGRCRAPA